MFRPDRRREGVKCLCIRCRRLERRPIGGRTSTLSVQHACRSCDMYVRRCLLTIYVTLFYVRAGATRLIYDTRERPSIYLRDCHDGNNCLLCRCQLYRSMFVGNGRGSRDQRALRDRPIIRQLHRFWERFALCGRRVVSTAHRSKLRYLQVVDVVLVMSVRVLKGAFRANG